MQGNELILQKDICFHPCSYKQFSTQLPVWYFPVQCRLSSWSVLSDDSPPSAKYNTYLWGLWDLTLPNPCLLQPDIFHFVHFAVATWTSSLFLRPLYLSFSLLQYSFPRSSHGFRPLFECHPHSQFYRKSPWIFIGGIDAEAEAPILLATWCKELTHWKRPWCWERLKAGGEGDDRWWDAWMASPTWWTWVWASSGRWLRTG